MTMSLDGRIAQADDQVGGLFEWYDAGSNELATANPDIRFHLDEVGANMMRDLMASTGALISGRRLFDITPRLERPAPIGAPVIVVSRSVPEESQRWPRTEFVSDSNTAVARAKDIAGDRDVVVASADLARQARSAGLGEEIAVSLVPIVMGGGQPSFAGVTGGPTGSRIRK